MSSPSSSSPASSFPDSRPSTFQPPIAPYQDDEPNPFADAVSSGRPIYTSDTPLAPENEDVPKAENAASPAAQGAEPKTRPGSATPGADRVVVSPLDTPSGQSTPQPGVMSITSGIVGLAVDGASRNGSSAVLPTSPPTAPPVLAPATSLARGEGETGTGGGSPSQSLRERREEEERNKWAGEAPSNLSSPPSSRPPPFFDASLSSSAPLSEPLATSSPFTSAPLGSAPMSPGQQAPFSREPFATSSDSGHVDGQYQQQQRQAELDEDLSRPKFEIKVANPQKVGDALSAHTVYTVATKTNAANYRSREFSVLRRYNDFLWLYNQIIHNNPGVVVPPVPEKVAVGRFSSALIEQRRRALQSCVQKMANHPLLYADEDLKLFLESDNFANVLKQRRLDPSTPTTPASAVESKGFMGMGSWGNSFTAPKFHESDEWFEREKAYLDGLEAALKQLTKAIDHLSRQRKELAAATMAFSEVLLALSTSSLSRNLSHALATLGNLQRKVKELYEVQAKADVAGLGNTTEEYARIVGSVRIAFASRVRTWTTWQTAENDLRRLKANHEKAKRQGRMHPDRLAITLQELAESERRCLDLKRDFDDVSKLVKAEVARFDKERVEDFKEAVEEFLEGAIDRQTEIIQEWEKYMDVLQRQMGANPNAAPPPPQHQPQHQPQPPQSPSAVTAASAAGALGS